jgi:2-polyprenyl-6-methoxyphenol hydroxylase-like FAD-dependent oxidoreductase
MTRASHAVEAAGATTWDALVVGAGPAGALAARQLALSGARTLLVDAKAFPRAKVCGACLNGRALAVLHDVGLGSLVTRLGGVGLGELRLHFRGRTARLPLPAGAALSRGKFDAALVDAAWEAGAQFLPETRAIVADREAGVRRVVLKPQGAQTPTVASARVVLVATGLGHQDFKDESIARTEVAAWSRIGAGCVVTDYPEVYTEQTIFMAVGAHGYVGLVRVEGAQLNLAAAFDRDFVRASGSPGRAAARLLAEAGLPPLAALDQADWQGTAGLTRRTRPVAAERVFLLGDATGYVEPFTGEGMGWALSSAVAVTSLARRAIAGWDDSLARDWGTLHQRQVGRRQRLCHGLAWLLRRPRLDRVAFELLTRAPGMARLMIGRVNAAPAFSQEHRS